VSGRDSVGCEVIRAYSNPPSPLPPPRQKISLKAGVELNSGQFKWRVSRTVKKSDHESTIRQ
jgi:hypothetical protein